MKLRPPFLIIPAVVVTTAAMILGGRVIDQAVQMSGPECVTSGLFVALAVSLLAYVKR